MIPESGRSPGEGNGNLFQYSCLEIPMYTGAWWAAVLGVTKSWTQPLTVWITEKLWEIIKEMDISQHLTFLLRILYTSQEVTELNMDQLTGSKLGKEYIKAIYRHPAYLTSMQSTSCERPG